MRTFSLLLVFFIGWVPAAAAKKKRSAKVPAAPVCQVPWPQIFARQALQAAAGRGLVWISPLRDDTSLPGDEWLGEGLSQLLARYLSADTSLSVLTEDQIRFSNGKPQYKIEGLFQHTQQWLRIFVQLKSADGELTAQWTVETPYPLHKQFFIGMKEAAQKILAQIGHGKTNAATMERIQNETEKVRAYENFIKGKMALQKYDPNQMEVAFIWFDESVREDNHYAQPYLGLMEAYGFLSLYHKQRGEFFNNNLEQLQDTLQTMKKKVAGAPKDNRFLSAHVHFVTGMRAMENGDAGKAASELQQAVDLVPEDGVAAYHLALSYDKIGQPDLAQKYRVMAKENNPCL